MKKLVVILFSLLCCTAFAQTIGYYNGKKIIDGVIIYKYSSTKLKNSEISINNDKESVDSYLRSIGATPPKQKFPTSIVPVDCENCVDISKIYTCNVPNGVDLELVISKLNGMKGVEYAEPSYVNELFFTPNDSEYANGNLWHLQNCNVLNAWDVEQGDSSVIVAIVDAGIDIIHKDLINKIAYNFDDPINGIDDDGDGYTDNYRGWDFGEGDNNPMNSVGIEHGTYVAGIASAEVNNEFGTAGVGYKTKILPIKVCPKNSSEITAGYEGIAYAATYGCKIINCSWGNTEQSEFGKDIVNYATYNCDALIVAAAGNSAATTPFYPASYSSVLSVGGTVAGDYVWADSNTKGSQYNYYVDLCAPAKGFYSLANDGKTFPMSGGGTSFATPIVAGAAALVRSKYPDFSALQVGEQLRVTADDIYYINSEAKYRDMLGHGRLNVYNALTNDTMPSLRITDISFCNKNGQPYSQAKDTLLVRVTIKNYLADATNATIQILGGNNILTPIQSDTTFAKIEANSEITCTFAFRVLITPPVDYSLLFKIASTADNSYSDYEYFDFVCNKQFYDFSIGNIKTTATGDGSIAKVLPKISSNGFMYKDFENCIFQGGIFIAENKDSICSRTEKTADFKNITPPTVVDADSCDVMVVSQYYAKNLIIDQILYGWNDTDAVIYDYQIANQRDSALYDVRFGMFIDWNILESRNNKIWYVDSLQLTVAASVNPRSFYTGIMPLDYKQSGMYAFNVANDIVYYNDGFNNTELWYVLTHSQTSAGTNSIYGTEVAAFNYSLIDSIGVGDTAHIRYAMLVADTQQELYDLAYQFKQKYNPNLVEPDTTKDNSATALIMNEQTRVYVSNDRINVVYQQSSESLAIQIVSVDGKCLSSVVVTPENQTGLYSMSAPETGMFFVVLRQNGVNRTFMFVQ
ncbi:MAG: S8 family serine peptidase [Bacteroidales bacterium]|nr:S8 family serine peptidase [Bacteroidales bacterium]